MRTIFRALVNRVWYQYGGVMLSRRVEPYPEIKTMSGEASLLEPNVNYKSVAYHVYLHGFSKALALQVDHLEMLVEKQPEAVRNST